MNFKELASEYKTPLYVYDLDYMSAQYQKLKEAFKAKKSILAYAVKANSNLSVVKHFATLGAGADCVSIGEVRRAFLAGIPKYKIIFSGVGKSDDEIREAIQKDILYINVESEAELARVNLIAKELDSTCRISIRVNPNIDPKTHPYISTGLHDNKFGVDLNSAKRMYIFANNSEHLDPVGIHFHIGSQLTQLQPIRESAEIVADLVRSLQKINIELKFFDIGGGIGVKYDDETTIKPYDYAQAILGTLTALDLTVICEPGRFLTANAGYFLTKVLYEKQNGDKKFVVVDGAMNDLLRPALYGAYHKIEAITESTSEPRAVDVVGPVCESGDFFAKNYLLPELQHNDLLVIHSAGSYGFGMGSNYNTRGRSAEVAVQNGEVKLIRRRESFEDLVALELEFLED
ncbi:MAG: diaminopimelate decarboxylase [Epsilonproteobacteria bacterium]|nr:diaminopimelate decarboxylase [Campylobacterota bacterium]PIP10319.1 MAG: diaminopimelate decarboxylase [Sulfurimonas sp. CG23_combo_of_CG06-09_8_20_14_all_36_33]PIS26589.1 MAG: diaminopimelate decarboxylase [Sulfurimonas sp. CG08_land_8_20_14_0_20_36_33]PIU34051.1 MAG: diaminopimelate decarboxylase [Sulfurimonas sp. CG07_land_8_20_14_0_80_36_56]PIV03879.1 MAG: diaminopimelate decarboxylase [Sulfurimonas sp. CG03_land_8_20_14_0_80_36_25]PIV34205.1 MAG: diaminopimelate decarboxylase [Sulfuri